MAKNRSIQTFEKRRRERDKQMKRQAKQAARHERKAQKRAAKRAAGEQPPDGAAPPDAVVTAGPQAPANDAGKEQP